MRNDPAVFVEYNVDDPANYRKTRFFAASSGRTLPLVVVDSSEATYGGSRNFEQKYRQMVNDAMKVEPKLEIYAYQEEAVSGKLRVYGYITNVSQETFGWDNRAAINIIIFEEVTRPVIHTKRIVRVAKEFDIEEDLKPGGRLEFDEQITVPGRPKMERTHAVVMVDYRPNQQGPFYSLQSALASTEAPPPQSPNHVLAGAEDLAPLPYSKEFSSIGARTEPNETPASCANAEGATVWFKYTPESDQAIVVDSLESSFDTVLSAWTGTDHPLYEVACNDDFQGDGYDGLGSKLELDLTAGTSYYIKVGGVTGAMGDFTLSAAADVQPTEEPTEEPTVEPTAGPTEEPTVGPTEEPTEAPTQAPPSGDIFLPIAKNRA
jgi:hypothetical protein